MNIQTKIRKAIVELVTAAGIAQTAIPQITAASHLSPLVGVTLSAIVQVGDLILADYLPGSSSTAEPSTPAKDPSNGAPTPPPAK